MTHLCPRKTQSRTDQSITWVEVFFFRTDCLQQWCRSTLLRDITTVPFCLPRYHLFSQELKFSWTSNFFSPVDPDNPCPWKCVRCVVDGDNGKMIFDFYSVNCLVWWIVDRIGKVGRDVVKPLIISDNQAFSCLIIKSFDNQTCDLTFEYLDYNNQWNFLKPVWKDWFW